jgi:hypothetical protein
MLGGARDLHRLPPGEEPNQPLQILGRSRQVELLSNIPEPSQAHAPQPHSLLQRVFFRGRLPIVSHLLSSYFELSRPNQTAPIRKHVGKVANPAPNRRTDQGALHRFVAGSPVSPPFSHLAILSNFVYLTLCPARPRKTGNNSTFCYLFRRHLRTSPRLNRRENALKSPASSTGRYSLVSRDSRLPKSLWINASSEQSVLCVQPSRIPSAEQGSR